MTEQFKLVTNAKESKIFKSNLTTIKVKCSNNFPRRYSLVWKLPIQAWNKSKISQYTPLKTALPQRENHSTNNAFWLVESRDAHHLHKNRVQLLQDLFGTPTWPPFHCFGTPNGRHDVMWKRSITSRVVWSLVWNVIRHFAPTPTGGKARETRWGVERRHREHFRLCDRCVRTRC